MTELSKEQKEVFAYLLGTKKRASHSWTRSVEDPLPLESGVLSWGEAVAAPNDAATLDTAGAHAAQCVAIHDENGRLEVMVCILREGVPASVDWRGNAELGVLGFWDAKSGPPFPSSVDWQGDLLGDSAGGVVVEFEDGRVSFCGSLGNVGFAHIGVLKDAGGTPIAVAVGHNIKHEPPPRGCVVLRACAAKALPPDEAASWEARIAATHPKSASAAKTATHARLNRALAFNVVQVSRFMRSTVFEDKADRIAALAARASCEGSLDWSTPIWNLATEVQAEEHRLTREAVGVVTSHTVGATDKEGRSPLLLATDAAAASATELALRCLPPLRQRFDPDLKIKTVRAEYDQTLAQLRSILLGLAWISLWPLRENQSAQSMRAKEILSATPSASAFIESLILTEP